MYMNDIYTVGNLRKNIKAALDTAITKPVYVQRGRDTFQISLVATDIPTQKPAEEIPPTRTLEYRYSPSAPVPVAKPAEPAVTSTRRKPDILDEIKARETLRDEDLEYSQDPDTNREIIKTAKADLDALWIEYNAL